MCHRKLHHGNDIQQELLKLFINRVGPLKKSGIDISFEQLIKYYK